MRRTKRDAAKSVIFFQYPWRFWRERLSGIYRYAEKVGWQVQVLEYGRTVLAAGRLHRRGWLHGTPGFPPGGFRRSSDGLLRCEQDEDDRPLQWCRP